MARARRTPDPVAELAGALRAGGGDPGDQLTVLTAALVAHDGLAVAVDDLPVAGRSPSNRRRIDGEGRAPTGPSPELLDAVAVARATAAAPDLLGQVHEALLDGAHRRAHGVHYTPTAIAESVVALVIPDHRSQDHGNQDHGSQDRKIGADVVAQQPDPGQFPRDGGARAGRRVCDPACGGGAFLLAAARVLEARGLSRAAIVDEALFGVDIDPLAVAVARTALILWAAGIGERAAAGNVVVGDTLLGRPPFPGLAGPADADTESTGFDVVVGNPPFQNQLERSTARAGRADLDAVRARFGADAFRYTDTAALFLLEACRWARPGGRVTLVLPQSLLAAADAAGVRRSVLDHARLRGLWVAGEDVFAASVRVCAPVLEIVDDGAPTEDDRPIRLWRGPTFEPVAEGPGPLTTERLRTEPTWSVLTRALHGAPVVDLGDGLTLASCATATAGFRDQYYGLAPYVHEADEVDGPAARLVTSGLLDPAHCAWGERPARFGGVRRQAPVVDLEALAAGDPTLDRWTRRILVPKVVVATQTRVLEAAIDEDGTWFPSVPTIALVPADGRLWSAAAVVLAPAVSVWAFTRHAGAALSSDALKVSARQLLEAPLPRDRVAWAAGARLLRLAAAAIDGAARADALVAFGAAMGAAYGVGDDVLDWWRGRLPGAVEVPA